MSKPNLKSQAKRKRELAKLDKRQVKDQKRAERKADRAGPGDVVAAAAPAPTAPAARAAQPGVRAAAAAPASAPKPPMTLAAAALLWKTSKVAKPTRPRS